MAQGFRQFDPSFSSVVLGIMTIKNPFGRNWLSDPQVGSVLRGAHVCECSHDGKFEKIFLGPLEVCGVALLPQPLIYYGTAFVH